jgi:phthiocerol/phenolphthiocerol synthesis type-I polyketide synthase D
VASTSTHKNNKGITFGLIFFDSSDVSPSGDKYRLVIESAKFADRHNFSSVWIPERHFTREGWLYPNPVVLHAALARETQQIHLRAGSVVMPLHDPIRVAEEWAMVDNLSGGRVGISFASGWHPNDFVFFPDNYAQRNELMYQGIETVRKLWRGESIQVKGGDGKLVDVRTYPPPIQAELPFWVTAAGNPKTFAGAGKMGAHLLTHMYNQSVDELAEKIRVYRESLAEHGFDPQSRQVSVMVHTFVSFSQEAVLAQAGGPFRNYLRSAGHLLNAIAYSRGQKVDLASLSEQDVEDYLHFVFERLVSTQRVIFGTPESCLNLIKQLYAAGVNEVACQIDFGLDTDIALANMVYLNKLKDLANAELTGPDGPPESFVAARLITPKQEDQSSLTGRDQSRGYEAVARPAPSSNGNSTPAVSKLVSQRQDRLEDVQKRCREDVPVAAFYDRLHARGIELSSSFRGIEQLWRCAGRREPAVSGASNAARCLLAGIDRHLTGQPAKQR